ncbi:hypothetical protein C0081_10975 [Cohaesibacter celericrescens]|uniref:Uncharacterized protein n=2 Tax=Cohaesibacter celericrescens TaxID=2067669 RepID=A0A2N5XRZ5_9HYPH|nr:hypothetical protein C0081_10975 [Cohaesibacter celericrescens]
MSLGLVMAMLLSPASLMAQTATTSTDVSAQTATTTASDVSTGTDSEMVIKENLFTVVPTQEQEVTDEATSVNLSFTGSANTQTPVDLRGLSASGFTRTVTVDGESITQVVVTKISNENDESVDLTTDSFSSQITLGSSTLDTATTISVDGNEDEFVSAVKALTATATNTEEEVVEEDSDTSEGTDTGSGASENDIAGAYETPEITAAEEEVEAVIDVRVTTEGCSVVVDEAQGVAKQQSKSQTYTDGALTSEDACSDSGTTFTIQKSYSVCEDVVDLTGLVANPQYISYYIDEDGTRTEISDCQPDTETSFTIVESEASCAVTIDVDSLKVIRNSALIYTNASNAQVKVQDCAVSETLEPYTLVADSYSCNMKHDFSAGYSAEMVMYTYEKEGVYYQATPCIDTSVKYTHEKVFVDDGVRICSMLVNSSAGTATPQYRTRITVDGEDQYIDECKPDTSATVGIYETTQGCEDPSVWTHDLNAGVSYGQSRFYYDTTLGREFITSCQSNAATYSHDITPTGWKYNDEGLVAQQLISVTIDVNGTVYPIATNYLAPGTTEVSYTYTGINDVADYSQRYYDGCYLMVPTNRSENYIRPDGTTYSNPIGQGLDLNEGDKCTREQETAVTYPKSTVSVSTKGNGRASVTMSNNTAVGVSYSTTFTALLPIKGGSARCMSQKSQDNSASVSYINYFQSNTRTKITYPADGTVSYSDWVMGPLAQYNTNSSSKYCRSTD